MKRPYQIFTILFLLSSITFSQSGATKSLEIGNQWVYYRSFANPITNEVIGDTIINDVKYVIVTNTDQRYQRADSTKVYYYSINYGIERVAIDFSKDEGTVCVTGDCETTTKSYQDFLGEQRAYLMIDGSIPSSFTYYHYTYIFGIGLYSWSASGHGNYTGNSFFLKYAKIGNDVYDDYPQIDVKYQQYFNTSTFVVQITTEDVIWGSAGEAYSMFNQIEYKIGHSKWQNLFEMPTIYLPVNLTLNLEVEGTNNISFHTVDIYGHERNDTYYFEFDLTPPSIKILNNVYSNIIFSEEIKEISIEYSVNDLNFDKIGYSMNNVDWIWSEEQQSTLNITVDNVKDYIQLKAVDLAGNESDIIEINVEKIADFKLSQNYPNPFNPTTQISYELPQESDVELVIYNTLGQEINKLVDENQAIGRYNIQWNGTNTLGEQVPGGVYFYALRTKDFTKTRKMLLLR